MSDTFIHLASCTTVRDEPRARLLGGTIVPVAEVDLGAVDVNVRSAAHARRIAAAFIVAADLLDAANKPAATHCPDCGEPVSPVEGTCPMCPPPFSRDLSGDLDAIPAYQIGDPAPLPAGHGPNHIDNAGHATLCAGECLPGTCVICGALKEADGSHVSALSGAHIPAEPQQVST